jgi:hypothetical protein
MKTIILILKNYIREILIPVNKEKNLKTNYRIGRRIIWGTVVGSWQKCRRWFGALSPFLFYPLNQQLPHNT